MAAKDWGLQCLRYEISEYGLANIFFLEFFMFPIHPSYIFHFPFIPGDISPPRGVRAAMEMQAEAERKKRAQVLESEGNVVI